MAENSSEPEKRKLQLVKVEDVKSVKKIQNQSMEIESTEEMQFLGLNNDCILEIFRRSPPNELCSMSFTCKRLKALAEYQMVFNFEHECMTIEANMRRASF